MLSMQLEQIRAKVNACYGYNAISRVRVTQTAPTGFAEGQRVFDHQPAKPAITPATQADAAQATADIKDPELRQALLSFGMNVITQEKMEQT